MPQETERTFSNALSADPPRTSLGLVTYCFENAKRARMEKPQLPDFADPATFIEQAWVFGANAAQIPFGVLPGEEAKKIRDLAARRRIHLESTINCPRSDADIPKFDAELRTLREIGVRIARTVIFPGRRYEQFKSMAAYRAAEQVAREALRRAIPLAEKNGIRLALENHKDQRVEERLALLQEFSSEALGVYLDVGNNIALLEDPVAVAEAFAPWTLTVHFKDQAVREFAEGFLLADIPLGLGCINLRKIVGIIREQQPMARFHLELITRDALEVPCLRGDYWATLGEMNAPQLAGQLQVLKTRSSPKAFPNITSQLPLARVEIERRNIEQSLAYAAKHLGFSA